MNAQRTYYIYNIANWWADQSPRRHQSTATLQLYQAFSEKKVIALNGVFKNVLLPRIGMISTDMPFEFIDKAQEQSIQVCGVNLEIYISHMYGACSRVGKFTNLFVYTPHWKTKDMYTKALQSTELNHFLS